jgi:hypothetical protein
MSGPGGQLCHMCGWHRALKYLGPIIYIDYYIDLRLGRKLGKVGHILHPIVDGGSWNTGPGERTSQFWSTIIALIQSIHRSCKPVVMMTRLPAAFLPERQIWESDDGTRNFGLFPSCALMAIGNWSITSTLGRTGAGTVVTLIAK